MSKFQFLPRIALNVSVVCLGLFLAPELYGQNTKSKSSPKPAVKSVAKAKPDYFPAIPVSGEFYTTEGFLPKEIGLWFTCKSEDSNSGYKKILDQVKNNLKSIGFVRNEKSFFVTVNSFGYRNDELEFKAATSDDFKRLAKKFVFYNSRRSGKVGGDLKQVCCRVNPKSAVWKGGVTIAQFTVRFTPIGSFTYGGNFMGTDPFHSDQMLIADLCHAFKAGSIEGTDINIFHTDNDLNAFLQYGLISVSAPTNYDPKIETTLTNKMLVGRWVGLRTKGSQPEFTTEVELIQGENGKIGGTLTDMNNRGWRSTKGVELVGSGDNWALKEGDLLSTEAPPSPREGTRARKAVSPRALDESPKLNYGVWTNPAVGSLYLNGFNAESSSVLDSVNNDIRLVRGIPDGETPDLSKLAGKWIGTLYQGGMDKYSLVLELTVDGATLTGTSTIKDSIQKPETFAISGGFEGTRLVLQERSTRPGRSSYWCIKNLTFLVRSDSRMLLGVWNGVDYKGNGCSGGTLELQKLSN